MTELKEITKDERKELEQILALFKEIGHSKSRNNLIRFIDAYRKYCAFLAKNNIGLYFEGYEFHCRTEGVWTKLPSYATDDKDFFFAWRNEFSSWEEYATFLYKTKTEFARRTAKDIAYRFERALNHDGFAFFHTTN